jgi:hypothetical protein
MHTKFGRKTWKKRSLGTDSEPRGTDLLAVFHFPPDSYMIRDVCKPIGLFATSFHASFLLSLFSDPEDESDIFP